MFLDEITVEITAFDLFLSPGDDRQLLGLLRSAKCDISRAVQVTKDFVDFLQYFEGATPFKMEETLRYFSKVEGDRNHQGRNKPGTNSLLPSAPAA